MNGVAFLRLAIDLECNHEAATIREELITLANQVNTSSVCISAAGFVSIDLTFVTGILSTVITYLIVMITNTK